jgi:signal recognition particle receptor subunit beta
MVVYNARGGETSVKIVYYGPGLSGKTTNLEHIYSKLPKENKGKMVSMKTRTDRTLFFDFLPMKIDKFNDMTVKFLIYTVPGQVYYNATRKLVLNGVDAIVFVADSSPNRMNDNLESLANLEDNLNQIGKKLSEIPWVLQYNKQDVEGFLSSEIMDRDLNKHHTRSFEAIAVEGRGVYETFEAIVGFVFREIENDKKKFESKMPEITQNTENKEEKVKVDAEVVPNLIVDDINSGADDGKSLNNKSAEERKEEHESVSEFVDSVLIEDDSIELESSRKGYEDYGHIVEFTDNNENVPLEDAKKQEGTVATEFINDPLERLAQKGEKQGLEENSDKVSDDLDESEETIIIPVKLSLDDIKADSNLRIILDLSVE